jgi:membrane-bound lytic murein transglycosylase B
MASALPSGMPAGPPQPDAPIPSAPAALAGALASTTLDLRAAIDRWASSGGLSRRTAPLDVQLLALYQQRMIRTLAGNPHLAHTVSAMLPPSVVAEVTKDVAAGSALLTLVSPVQHPGQIRTRPAPPPGVLLGYYRDAQGRFGVPWQILAAVNFVESKFGRVVSASSAGAQGPMQFIPSTWAAYGMGGDVHDPHDAILGAANYLHANGAPLDERNALYHYNPVDAYVNAVSRYARNMTIDPRTFYAYYNWQVFVLTKNGERRLTGPGL